MFIPAKIVPLVPIPLHERSSKPPAIPWSTKNRIPGIHDDHPLCILTGITRNESSTNSQPTFI